MIVAILNLLMSNKVVTLKLLHARLVLLLELLALFVVMLDHGLVLFMKVMELFVHVLEGHLNLMDLIVDIVAAILVMCLGMLCEVFFVELFRLLVDALVLVNVLLIVIVTSVPTKAQVHNVDWLIVNEDVHVKD